MKLGVVLDAYSTLQLGHDSTLAILLEATRRDWPIYSMQACDLFFENDRVLANTTLMTVDDDSQTSIKQKGQRTLPLDALDVILMRKDPPFDINYIMTTYFLDHAKYRKVWVINDPQSLRDANEKFFATHFAKCMPATMITSNLALLKKFHQQHQRVVFKPLDLMGGQGIFFADKHQEIEKPIRQLSHNGTKPIMVQCYLPEIEKGDKRILLIDGKPFPYALMRFPKPGSILANMAAGGTTRGATLTSRDYWICKQLEPTLIQKNLLFVGIDVIGGYLTEINVTSPTGIVEIDQAFGVNVSASLLDIIAKKHIIS